MANVPAHRVGDTKDEFDTSSTRPSKRPAWRPIPELTADRWKEVIAQYANRALHTGKPFPRTCTSSRSRDRGRVSTRALQAAPADEARSTRSPTSGGTAAASARSVFGNLGEDSGTARRVHPAIRTPREGAVGEYLRNAQGEDVVAGIRTPMKISDLQASQPTSYAQFRRYRAPGSRRTTRHAGHRVSPSSAGTLVDAADRSAKRSAEAAVRVRDRLRARKIITTRRSDPARRMPRRSTALPSAHRSEREVQGRWQGLNASPGAATGQIVFGPPQSRRTRERRRIGDPRPVETARTTCTG